MDWRPWLVGVVVPAMGLMAATGAPAATVPGEPSSSAPVRGQTVATLAAGWQELTNARTEGAAPFAIEDYISAARCAHCHETVHAQWRESVHRWSATEPFYRESVALLEAEAGVAVTAHCQGCHSPMAVLTGTVQRGERLPGLLEAEGISCIVCHSITAVTTDGTGSYVLRRPSLLDREGGDPATGATDEEVLADLPSHRRAMLAPVLQTSEFCAACHKGNLPTPLTGTRPMRDFSTYDEWQQSSYSGQSLVPGAASRSGCQSCHMARWAVTPERGTANRKLASHRWLGGNMAVPGFEGATSQQAREVARFLTNGLLRLSLFSVDPDTGARQWLPEGGANQLEPDRQGTCVVDVVVANRGIGHAFPTQLRDLIEVRRASGTAEPQSTEADRLDRQAAALAWRDLGRALLAEGMAAEAVEGFLVARQLAPEELEHLVEAANAMLTQPGPGAREDVLHRALALVSEVLALEPDNLLARFTQSRILAEAGRWAEALPGAEAAVKAFPRDRRVLAHFGQLALAFGRVDEAEAAFEALAALDPQAAHAHRALADIYGSTGRERQRDAARVRYLDWRPPGEPGSRGAASLRGHVRVAKVLRRQERLLDGARRYPPLEVQPTPRLVVRA